MTVEPGSEERDELARAHEALAAAQDKSYWLDRWQLDLNALMRRRGASEARAALRALRAVYRTLYNGSDRLRRGLREVPGKAARARGVVGEEREQAGALTSDTGSSAAASRLRASVVTDRLRDRVDPDDPGSLVAVQRADMLVQALGSAGGAPEGEQRWLAVGPGADGVLQALREAFPDLQVSDNGAVDVAVAISGWSAGDSPLARIDELRDSVKPGGRLLLATDSRATGAGPAADALLAHCTPDWRVALYLPGGMEGGRDLYVLERA
jgi:hypothetical protein